MKTVALSIQKRISAPLSLMALQMPAVNKVKAAGSNCSFAPVSQLALLSSMVTDITPYTCQLFVTSSKTE
jgi:hypothetical protein